MKKSKATLMETTEGEERLDEAAITSSGYEVKLDIFQGPLDLLLYLIKKNEIDVYNIPITLITGQYIEYLQKLQSLNLDLAGEYLVLAATLIHIKSRMLLPLDPLPGEEEDDDPRRELVEQLIEYQAFKEALLELDKRPLLERDVFKRGVLLEDDHPPPAEDEALEVSLFDLMQAFKKIASTWDKKEVMEIDREKITLAEKMNDILTMLLERDGVSLEELLIHGISKSQVLYTFLALLELAKMRLIRIYQAETFGRIRIFAAAA